MTKAERLMSDISRQLRAILEELHWVYQSIEEALQTAKSLLQAGQYRSQR